MKHRLALRLAFALLAILTTNTCPAQPEDTYGFTLRELQSALTSAGLSAQRICNIQTFGWAAGITKAAPIPAYIAVLSTSRAGWLISVFRRVSGGFQLDWTSHKLPYEFSVASPQHLSVEYIGDEPVVMFAGCAPHMCDDTGGYLLYSTSTKQAFYVRYSGHSDSESAVGAVTFSQNALEPSNQAYKQALQRRIDSLSSLKK